MKLTNQVTVVNKLNKKLLQSIDILSLDKDDLYDYLNKQYLNNPFIKVRYKDRSDYINNSVDSALDEIPDVNSIEEDLIFQLNLLRLTQDETVLVKSLIYMLDDDGYLRISLAEISDNLGVSESDLYKALRILQSLEPAGIGARTLKECLMVQLKRRGLLTNSLVLLLNNLSDIKALNKSQLAHLCETPEESIVQMLSLIKSLNPNPAVDIYNRFEKYTNIISPDVIVSKNRETDEIDISLSGFCTPDVSFDYSYYDFVLKRCDPSDIEFLKGCREKAEGLIYDLKMRSKTIIKVVDAIVLEQKDFFYKNKPLKNIKQKDVANLLNVHESTVSRSIYNKYLSFNNINYPIQDFFNYFALPVTDKISSGADLSDIGLYIKRIINKESKDKVLSDLEISKILGDEGIQISRRTVAKYRLKFNIPSSEQRRHMWTRYLHS